MTTQTSTVKSITKPMKTKPTQKPGKECEHGQYYPYPTSCNQFLICVNGDLIAQQCGPGLNWNDNKNMCDWAFKNPCNHNYNKKAALKTKNINEKVIRFDSYCYCDTVSFQLQCTYLMILTSRPQNIL